jgi:carboxymethylenebutenolidase
VKPAVILLHGSDGPSQRYRGAASQIAAAGFRVFFVRYMDSTGDTRARFGSMSFNLPTWAAAARQSVDFVDGQLGVDRSRIAIIGVSLGGALALDVAARDRRIRAIVEYFGYAPDNLLSGPFPPTLILHGENDRIVPVATAYRIEQAVRAGGSEAQIKIYPGEGHGFSPAATADAQRTIAAFLSRRLGGRR